MSLILRVAPSRITPNPLSVTYHYSSICVCVGHLVSEGVRWGLSLFIAAATCSSRISVSTELVQQSTVVVVSTSLLSQVRCAMLYSVLVLNWYTHCAAAAFSHHSAEEYIAGLLSAVSYWELAEWMAQKMYTHTQTQLYTHSQITCTATSTHTQREKAWVNTTHYRLLYQFSTNWLLVQLLLLAAAMNRDSPHLTPSLTRWPTHTQCYYSGRLLIMGLVLSWGGYSENQWHVHEKLVCVCCKLELDCIEDSCTAVIPLLAACSNCTVCNTVISSGSLPLQYSMNVLVLVLSQCPMNWLTDLLLLVSGDYYVVVHVHCVYSWYWYSDLTSHTTVMY